MDSVIRGLVVYLVLFVIFRLAGNRTLAQSTSFDLILLLIISETTQQAMIGRDNSLTNSALLVVTLVGSSILFSIFKQHSPRFDRWTNGLPLLLYDNGRFLEDRMQKARLLPEEIMEAARADHGLHSMDEVAYAVLEANGQVSVVPKQKQ